MIRVQDLRVRAGRFELAGINLEIPTGACAVLMGKTGSGKTTLLEAICGLRRVVGGSIWLDEAEVTHLDPARRGIGYVPQDRALFQTMTVEENLAFGLRIRRWPDADIRRAVGELAEMLGVAALLGRRPPGLSGGESQRVALGRALAIRPGFLCLDEPLSALDEDTREGMYQLLESIRRQTGVTILHVTHHPGEAERLASRIYLLRDGRVELKGTA